MYSIDAKILAARTAHCLLLVVCFLLFCYQAYDLSVVYLEYKTTTKVMFAVSDDISPAVALCIRYSDIVDWDSVNRELGLMGRESLRRAQAFREYSKLMRHPTVGQIFKFTPEVNQSLDCILHRASDGFVPIPICGPDAHRIFDVTKAYVQVIFSCCYLWY